MVDQLAWVPANAMGLVTNCMCGPTTHAALAILAPFLQTFRGDYCAMLTLAKRSERRVTVSMVYDALQGLTSSKHIALLLFNDAIQGKAAQQEGAAFELRGVRIEMFDFATSSPIEASGVGSQ